jgi:hypothetical protein
MPVLDGAAAQSSIVTVKLEAPWPAALMSDGSLSLGVHTKMKGSCHATLIAVGNLAAHVTRSHVVVEILAVLR